VLERLGGLYEERGAPEEAVPYYRRFVALLKGADPVLQPRVAAVEGRLRALELELPVGAGADSAGDRPGASFLDEERDGSGAAWR
jgi:hypothetical protein